MPSKKDSNLLLITFFSVLGPASLVAYLATALVKRTDCWLTSDGISFRTFDQPQVMLIAFKLQLFTVLSLVYFAAGTLAQNPILSRCLQ